MDKKVTTRFDLNENTLRVIEGNITDLLEPNFKPIKKTYSSKDKNQLQVLVHLIQETDKIVFPNGEGFIASNIYDELTEYGYSKGLDDLIGIVKKFVHWEDTNKEEE